MRKRIIRNKILESAVMLCILNSDGKDYLVLEKRAKRIKQAGEISFPGGKKDEKDKNFLETAIRETIEELGLKRKNIKNTKYFGSFFFLMGVLIEAYICYLDVEKIEDILYNRDEVEKLLIVPIEFFMENKPIIEEILITNKPTFDPRKYKFPKTYEDEWYLPSRKIYIYMYEDECIWGMTSEIIVEFIKILKEEGKVGSYEYRKRLS